VIYGSLYAGEGAAISPMVKATGDSVLIFPFWDPCNAGYGSMRSKEYRAACGNRVVRRRTSELDSVV